MDITRPPLEFQAGPQMNRMLLRQVDVEGLVERVLKENPEATVDQVTDELRRKGYPVSGLWVAVAMRRRPTGVAQRRG